MLVLFVSDAEGVPLSGVSVVLTGPQGARTGYTARDGGVRFPGLVPGSYDASLALQGFTTLDRQELLVSAQRVATVPVTLRLSPIEQTITVAGNSPLIDVTQVRLGATVDERLLEATPTPSGIWSGVLDRVPGVVNSTIDVGGADSGQQSNISALGSLQGQNQFNLNGTATHDVGRGPGMAWMYYSVASFDEVAVATGAQDIEIQTPGVTVNMVSKYGGNEVSGLLRAMYSNDALVSANIDEDLEDSGVTRGNPNTLLADLNAQVGGPLLSDRLFGFVDFWNFETARQVEGVPADEKDDARVRDWTINSTWQINPDHRVSGRYFYSDLFKGNRALRATRPPESALVQSPSGSQILQAHWQGVLSPISYAEVRASQRWSVFTVTGRRPGSANPHPGYQEGVPVTLDLSTGQWSGMAWEIADKNRLSQIAANLSRIIPGRRLSHDLKFGGGFWDQRNWNIDVSPGGAWQYTEKGIPVRIELDNSIQRDVLANPAADTAALFASRSWSLYAQDSLSFDGRLTVNLGLRFDHSRSWIPAQRRPDSAWAGMIPIEQSGERYNAQAFAAQEVAEFNNLVPRLSVLYDVADNGRTVARASYARYSLQQGSTLGFSLNENATGSNTYTWDDPNHDGIFQFGEQGRLLRSRFPRITSGIDPELRSPIQEEVTVGVDHALGRHSSVSGTFVVHRTLHQIGSVNIGVPYGIVAEELGVPDSYTPVPYFDPGPDGIPGTADDGGPITVYDQDEATSGQDFLLTTNLDRWGLDAPVRYRGVEISGRRRYADGWQVMASWTIGRSTSGLGAFGDGRGGLQRGLAFDNPNADINRYGLTEDDRRHMIKATGSYLIGRIGVNVGANLRYESGIPARRTFRTPPGLLSQGAVDVAAAGRGEDTNPYAVGKRLDSILMLDLRVQKDFVLGGGWGFVSVFLDAFNLTNDNAVRDMFQVSGPAYGRVDFIVPPRMWRVGAGWSF